MTIFSGQSVISRVYTSRFGNGTGSHGTSTEVVLKKYQVPGTVPSGKPPKSEPYRTVPCRTMQWKSAIRAPETWVQSLLRAASLRTHTHTNTHTYTGTSKKKCNIIKNINIFCHSFQKVKPIHYIDSLHIE